MQARIRIKSELSVGKQNILDQSTWIFTAAIYTVYQYFSEEYLAEGRGAF